MLELGALQRALDGLTRVRKLSSQEGAEQVRVDPLEHWRLFILHSENRPHVEGCQS